MKAKEKLILEEYNEQVDDFKKLEKKVLKILQKIVKDSNVRVYEINHRIKEKESLVGKLERNFRYIVDQFIDDQQKAFRFSADNIPIPANVIGGIFRKKSLQANIPAFAKVVEQSVYENIVKPVLQSIRNMDQDTLCLKLVQDIAVAEWPKIPQQLDAVSTSEKEIIIESIDDYPRRKINLDVDRKSVV